VNRFLDKVKLKIKENNSLVCVGLDINPEAMPDQFKSDYLRYQRAGSEHDQARVIHEFGRWIIKQTAPYTCVYKPQLAYYEAMGLPGMMALMRIVDEIHRYGFAALADSKRGDIAETAKMYAKALFEVFDFDATTINAYMGQDVVEPFLAYQDRFAFVLTKTSNKSSGDFQDLSFRGDGAEEKPLYQIVAEKAQAWNAEHKNCGMVVGATYPKEMELIRKLTPEMWYLVPGFGAQGADPEALIPVGVNEEGDGLVGNSSRGVIYAKDPAKAAQKLRDEINQYRWKQKQMPRAGGGGSSGGD